MKIFFPIIAALILICVGSCGYANYCKKPSLNDDEENEVGTFLQKKLAKNHQSRSLWVNIIA